jgi:hypothetical protein
MCTSTSVTFVTVVAYNLACEESASTAAQETWHVWIVDNNGILRAHLQWAQDSLTICKWRRNFRMFVQISHKKQVIFLHLCVDTHTTEN